MALDPRRYRSVNCLDLRDAERAERAPVTAPAGDDGARAGAGRASRTIQRRPSAGAATAPGPSAPSPAGEGLVVGLVVEHGPPTDGQMLASVFRERASTILRDAADAALGATAMFGAPALDSLRLALASPGSDLEAIVRAFAPEAQAAATADELLVALTASARRAASETAAP
ncbi:MAG TPA: hypothetical protein VHE35_00340, partial [Kofleriaceae bacterium]|nr:hypothetical protein [Kofleriaceae bacterium]